MQSFIAAEFQFCKVIVVMYHYNSYYTIFPFPVLIGVVFLYFPDLFGYLFLGYPLEYCFHFFSAYIMPFHNYFCGCLLSVGSLPCFNIFTHQSVPLQKIERIDWFYTLCKLFCCDCRCDHLDKLQFHDSFIYSLLYVIYGQK